MPLQRFRVTEASYAGVPLTNVEVSLVVDDPLTGNIGFWTAFGTPGGDAVLPRHGRLVGENELGAAVEGDALLQEIRGRPSIPIKLTGQGPVSGVPPRDLVDDLYEMNALSEAIVGTPMGIALAPTNPAREKNGRLIQDARMCQLTDAAVRERLIEIAKSSLGKSSIEEHALILEGAYTAAALLGSTMDVGRIVESLGDERFCRWLASAQFI